MKISSSHPLIRGEMSVSKMTKWHVAGASVVGESHVRRGRDNDDAIAFEQKGGWTAIVVCDGAGSSSRSREGSDLVTQAFIFTLLKISDELDKFGPGPWLNDAIIRGILDVRSELASIAGSYDLNDFHCTLVAALVSTNGGFTVHIGDGAILVGRTTADGQQEIDVHSHPENGEYANETFFITESTWLRNLRIKPLGTCDFIVLTTDGAASVLIDSAIKVSEVENLFHSISELSRDYTISTVIEHFLETDYAKACSSDDKTLAVGFCRYSMPMSLANSNGQSSIANPPQQSTAYVGSDYSHTTGKLQEPRQTLGNRSVQRKSEVTPRRPPFFFHAAVAALLAAAIISMTVFFIYSFKPSALHWLCPTQICGIQAPQMRGPR